MNYKDIRLQEQWTIKHRENNKTMIATHITATNNGNDFNIKWRELEDAIKHNGTISFTKELELAELLIKELKKQGQLKGLGLFTHTDLYNLKTMMGYE